jgi:thiamine biosynthesis protein ThiI
MSDVLLVHYSEIGTKGRNRSHFERRLRDDIAARLGPLAGKARVESGRVIIDLVPDAVPSAVHAALASAFGVAWYAFARVYPRDLDAVEAATVALAATHPEARTFKIFARRSDKAFPWTSQEICNRLGKSVAATGKTVKLEGHDLAIEVEVLPREILLFAGRHEGLRGMPRASSGELLCLFSGGIDSPVAAWQMMRRGGRVDLLHFHPFRRASEMEGTKIIELHRILRGFHPESQLLLSPHDRYYSEAALKVPPAFETVLFRRFMFRTAALLAERRGHRALITGDCLGQVASQTLENLAAAQSDLPLPVLQPLIATDKDDIVRLAKKIGTFEPSILPYKDCCSLLSRKARTKVPVPIIRRLEEELHLDRMAEDTLKVLELWDGQTFRPLFK